jgi:hypothetical protein
MRRIAPITEARLAHICEMYLQIEGRRSAQFRSLIAMVRASTQLSKADCRPSRSRPAAAIWEQRLRNIKSHKRKGRLVGIKGGLRLR